LTLHYDDAALTGLKPATLALYMWDPGSLSYQVVPAILDPATHTLTAQFNHPGEFVLAAEADRLYLPFITRQ
jgi:hypothetical protein